MLDVRDKETYTGISPLLLSFAMNSGAVPVISLVTPLWNEEANIEALRTRVRAVFDQLGMDWEWVAVDDGSKDATHATVHAAVQCAPRWQVIRFSRNFGQQAAYRAGLDAARGRAVIFLDADMQDPPECIPDLVEQWKQGARLVVGCRRSRPERGLRGLLLRRFHDVFHAMTGGIMPRDSGTFGLMDRVIVDQLKAMPEASMFLPAMRSWVGFRQEVIWYDRQQRVDQPKQTYAKLFNYAWDGITSFSSVPLRLISWVGLVVFFLSLGYAALLLAIRISQVFGFMTGLTVPGFTTLAVVLLGLGGVQLLSVGILGEYLSRIYTEVKGRPRYVIEKADRSD
jgi:polyisoprenyl-phosphate glycosyltransferase